MTFRTIDSFRHDAWMDRSSEGTVLLTPGAHVLIDMDNTGADFNGTVERLWVRHLPHIRKPNFSELTQMRVQDLLRRQESEQIKRLFLQPGFFRSLRPLPGFVKAVREMREHFQVWFCTAPMIGDDCPCASEKMSWLREYFGLWGEERCIITHDKTMVHGDALIDDNPCIQGRRVPSWQHIYFHQPCNRPSALAREAIPVNQQAVARLLRWSEWRDVLRLTPLTSRYLIGIFF